MHMADALLNPAVGGTMYALSTVTAAYSIKKVHQEADMKKVPVMGVMGAFVFATQMINFTIPGTGSSGHLCGGMLLTAILGPYAAFLTMIGVLLIQCLMFADGGLLALGANVWNMAFYGCFIGYFIWKGMTKRRLDKVSIIISSILGSVLSLQLGAFSVTLETLASGITELPFSVFAGMMQPIHLAIGIVEGLITAAVLVFVYEARPEMLYQVSNQNTKKTMSIKKTLGILAVITLLIGGGLSLYASSNPDGLEWSIEKVTGSTELQEPQNAIIERAGQIQENTAMLPDYQFETTESGFGTSVSGIVGSLLVLVLCGGICFCISKRKKKESTV